MANNMTTSIVIEGNDGGSIEGSNDELVFPVLR